MNTSFRCRAKWPLQTEIGATSRFTQSGVLLSSILGFNSQFWINNMLSKVTEFYDVFLSSHCITIVGIKMHDLRLSFKIVS